ncbi:MAG: aminoglycoside 6-adenylyltransferase [Lachnospiraceae bacterium]|nr:aminoglycoside 6-adenylyltransferase [Lachnospiraceae bacterium]
MLSWYILLREEKPVDLGILNSNFEKFLDTDLFQPYKKTYPDADYEHIRQAGFAVVELWDRTGRAVAGYVNIRYPEETEKNMIDFIHKMQDL